MTQGNQFQIDKLQLIGDRIIVKEEKIDQVGGFILMENSKDKPLIGSVILLGDGKVKNDQYSTPVKVGHKIMFYKWNAQEITLQGNKYMCLKFDDVLGVIND